MIVLKIKCFYFFYLVDGNMFFFCTMTKVVYFIVLFELFNGKIVCGHSNGDYPVSFSVCNTGYLYVECF